MQKEMICATCGNLGKPKKHTKGSFLVEIGLWCLFLFPGLIYSLWRVSSKQSVCRKCGSTQLVPTDSPVGKKLLADLK